MHFQRSALVCLCIYWPGKNFVFVNHLTPRFCVVIISDCMFKTWTYIFGIEIMFRCNWVALFGILNAASSIWDAVLSNWIMSCAFWPCQNPKLLLCMYLYLYLKSCWTDVDLLQSWGWLSACQSSPLLIKLCYQPAPMGPTGHGFSLSPNRPSWSWIFT